MNPCIILQRIAFPDFATSPFISFNLFLLILHVSQNLERLLLVYYRPSHLLHILLYSLIMARPPFFLMFHDFIVVPPIKKPPLRFELRTCTLQECCSTVELKGQQSFPTLNSILPYKSVLLCDTYNIFNILEISMRVVTTKTYPL